MLERCGGREAGSLFQLLDQLPAIEGIQKIDIAGFSVQNLNGKLPVVLHENFGGLLVGVAAVFQQ